MDQYILNLTIKNTVFLKNIILKLLNVKKFLLFIKKLKLFKILFNTSQRALVFKEKTEKYLSVV